MAKKIHACFLVAVCLAFLFTRQEKIPMPSLDRHFIGKTILKKAMKSLCGKGRKDQPRTSLRNGESFIPLLKPLTMNAIRVNTTKYSKAIVLQR